MKSHACILLWVLSIGTTSAVVWRVVQLDRWQHAEIRKEKVHFVAAICAQIARNRPRYESVAKKTGVPWRVIAAIHNMECGLSFRQHLHNGDPLTARTRHVPAGRPRDGATPFA